MSEMRDFFTFKLNLQITIEHLIKYDKIQIKIYLDSSSR